MELAAFTSGKSAKLILEKTDSKKRGDHKICRQLHSVPTFVELGLYFLYLLLQWWLLI